MSFAISVLRPGETEHLLVRAIPIQLQKVITTRGPDAGQCRHDLWRK